MNENTNSCFVIMPIDRKRGNYEDLYKNHIKRIIEHELISVSCIRADELFVTSEPKYKVIQDAIKKCTFAIADISERNPNVYYEIGYAQAKGKKVILIKNKVIGQLPFDIKSLNVLIYDKDKIGYNDICKQILATLEEEKLGYLIRKVDNETTFVSDEKHSIIGNWIGCYWINGSKHTVRLFINKDTVEDYHAICIIDIEKNHKRYRIRETMNYNQKLTTFEWNKGNWVEFIGTTYLNELDNRLDYWMDAYAINTDKCKNTLYVKIWDRVNKDKQDVLFERI